jgi:hypothetical protein
MQQLQPLKFARASAAWCTCGTSGNSDGSACHILLGAQLNMMIRGDGRATVRQTEEDVLIAHGALWHGRSP